MRGAGGWSLAGRENGDYLGESQNCFLTAVNENETQFAWLNKLLSLAFLYARMCMFRIKNISLAQASSLLPTESSR